MRTRSLQRFVAVGAAVLALTGCVDGPTSMEPAAPSSTASSVTTTATVPSTTTTTEDPAAAVLAAYEGFNRAFVESRDPYDPENPELERYATGDLLERIRSSFRERAAAGQRGIGDLIGGDEVKVQFLSSDEVNLLVCVLDRTSRLDADGVVITPPDEDPLWVSVNLKREGDEWKVHRLSPGEAGQCELS